MLEYRLCDGFYLSVYIDINKYANIYNITLRHDQCIALWKVESEEIALIRYWELERISSMKQHSLSFFNCKQATNFINDLLREYGLNLSDIIEVWGTPLIEKGHNVKNVYDEDEFAFHSLAHLFSAIYLDTELFYNSNIIGMALDGGPDNIIDSNALEKKYYAGCVSINGKLDLLPINSPGRLWSSLKKVTNLREGSLMALGTACTCFCDLQYSISNISLKGKESFLYCKNLIDNFMEQIEYISSEKLYALESYDRRFTEEENRISIVVKNVNIISQIIVCKNIDEILKKYNINCKDTYLAVAGGFALNCPTNNYIMSKYKFKGFLAPPCVNDSGMALGIGLYMFKKLAPLYKYKFKGAFCGNSINELNINKYKIFIEDVSDFKKEICYSDLKNGPIIWCEGNSEIGPRALGHRSILGLTDDILNKEKLNKIKKRQWWRPVAPIIMQEYVDDWFEEAYESKYMLHTFKVKREKMGKVPAILHLDRTARVQTISKHDNPILYELLEKCMEESGIPMICNTSLNDKGEPIIEQFEELINFALRKKIQIAYINGKRIKFINYDLYKEQCPDTRSKYKFIYDSRKKREIEKQLKALEISKNMMVCYFDNIHILKDIELFTLKDAKKLKMLYMLMKEKFQVDFED